MLISKIKNAFINSMQVGVAENGRESKYLKSVSARVLLSKDTRRAEIFKVKRLLSVTDRVWEEHYLFAITRFAELVQALPASEVHHHSYNGGLLDHTLEALHLGIKATQGFVLPPNCQAEQMAEGAEKWRFGAFVSILTHDIGKIVTDMEVVYRNKETDGFKKWHPWYGIIPIGSEYTFRYKEKDSNPAIAKQLHEKAGVSLLPKLLTEKATHWIFSDPELLGQLFSTITHSTFGGGALSEIVQIADRGSVSKNMGASPAVESSAVDKNTALSEKLITAFRTLANTGSFKRNRPGAAIWITKNHTWAVSKATMESVRDHLLAEGHSGVPRNPVSLFSILNERGLIVANASGESVWRAEVQDESNNWNQKLTFLKFRNSVVWASSVPPAFDGEIVPEGEGNQSTEMITKAVESEESTSKDTSLVSDSEIEAKSVESNAIANKREPAIETVRSEDSNRPTVKHQQSIAFPVSGPFKENDFFVWLFKNINKRKLIVNSPKSPIHFTKDYVLLVTPAIYLTYFNSSPLKKSLYKSKSGDKPPHTALQREIEALSIHKKNHAGENICKVLITGARSQSDMKCYVFDRSNFPEFAKFSANPALNVIFN